MGVALIRALEALKPEGERICSDPYAVRFLDADTRAKIESPGGVKELWDRLERGLPGLAGSIVARVRYFDDFARAVVAGGTEQVVILGAGYDTRAYRLDELNRALVFEVDHPGTQPVKKEKILEIFGSLPGHVTYVPVDFEADSLAEKLAEHGYDPSRKTLFVWEGVTMYIPLEAVDRTLAFITRNSGKESTVIFDYGRPPQSNSPRGKKFQRHVERQGEPTKFGLEPGTVKPFLAERGFTEICDVTGEDYRQLYFHGKNEGRRVSSLAFAHAVVE